MVLYSFFCGLHCLRFIFCLKLVFISVVVIFGYNLQQFAFVLSEENRLNVVNFLLSFSFLMCCFCAILMLFRLSCNFSSLIFCLKFSRNFYWMKKNQKFNKPYFYKKIWTGSAGFLIVFFAIFVGFFGAFWCSVFAPWIERNYFFRFADGKVMKNFCNMISQFFAIHSLCLLLQYISFLLFFFRPNGSHFSRN